MSSYVALLAERDGELVFKEKFLEGSNRRVRLEGARRRVGGDGECNPRSGAVEIGPPSGEEAARTGGQHPQGVIVEV